MISIIPGNRKGKCFICGREGYTEEHHIFEGSCRPASEANGLKVDICLDHHRGFNGVHTARGEKLKEYLHEVGQQAYEEYKMKHESMTPEQAREAFIKEFIKSRL